MPRAERRRLALGAHMSVAGGVTSGLDRALKIRIDAVQIFTKNNNRWSESPLASEEIARFREAAKRFERAHLISHAAYLINLSAPDQQVHKRSLEALCDELERAHALGLPWVVLHPGSHRGSGEEWGIQRIADSLNQVFGRTRGLRTGVLLETTAGQGDSIGHRFEHLAQIMKRVRARKRLGVCLDTCHIFAAGYEIRDRSRYLETIAAFDRIVGIDRLHALHINDSRKPLGSRVDRHAHIGEGEIGLDGFANFLNDPRLRHLPMILETPKGPEMKEDVRNLKRLRKLIGTVRIRP